MHSVWLPEPCGSELSWIVEPSIVQSETPEAPSSVVPSLRTSEPSRLQQMSTPRQVMPSTDRRNAAMPGFPPWSTLMSSTVTCSTGAVVPPSWVSAVAVTWPPFPLNAYGCR